MHILVTGAAGFLGSHLCDRLLAEGHTVIGLDNFLTGSPENIAHLSNNPRFSFIHHDVSQFISLHKKLDAVLHFASPASPNPHSPRGYPNLPIETLKASSLGTFNTLGLARANNARYMFASTSEVYGDPLEHPQSESYWGHVNPIGPRSMYDEAKRFGEATVMAYHRVHGMDTRIVRIFNTYGPRMSLDDGRVIPNLIQQALRGEPLTIYGDGSQTRSFCYVDDLIEGIYRLLFSEEHLPVNLGNDREISILEIAHLINKLTGNRAGFVFRPEDRIGNDPQRRRPDLTRARTLLGWQPTIDLETGLRRTIEFFRQQLSLR
ncbi:MAG: SDR family oxidoreductase [Anaerolineales bacterium]|nr:SDR family oxidoreductase [Anaerolineales bacterium]